MVFDELFESTNVVKEGDGLGYQSVVIIEVERIAEIGHLITDAIGVVVLEFQVGIDVFIVAIEA